jgi:hypothetical protein
MTSDEYFQEYVPEPTSGRCESQTRGYNGTINCDQVSWIGNEIRRAIETATITNKGLRARTREIVLDAIIDGAILEIADILNLEVDRANIRTKRL